MSFTVGLYKRITLKKQASEIIYLYNFIHKKRGGGRFFMRVVLSRHFLRELNLLWYGSWWIIIRLCTLIFKDKEPGPTSTQIHEPDKNLK